MVFLLTHLKWENDYVISSGRLWVVMLGSHICCWAGYWNRHLEVKWNHLVRSLTCDQLPDLQVCGLAKQSHQRWDATTVFQGDFVVVIGLPIHQVPQSPTGTTVDFRHPVIQQVHQELYASLSPYLKEQGKELWPWGVRFCCLSPSTVSLSKPATDSCTELNWGLQKGRKTKCSSWIPSLPTALISYPWESEFTAFKG